MQIVAEGGGASNSYMTFAIIGVFIAIFYFLLIRPGQKQKKAHQEMVTSIGKGDEIMTAGGLYGTITRVESDAVIVEIARKTEIKLAKSSIARVLNDEEEEEHEEEELEEEDYQEDEYEEEGAGEDEDTEEDEDAGGGDEEEE